MVQEAIRLVNEEMTNHNAREAILKVLGSGRAVSIAEKFYPVKDARSLLVGVCCGIMWAWEICNGGVDDGR